MYANLAGYSGAVLGYIADNRRGAYLGYKLGKKLGKSSHMVPIPSRVGRRRRTKHIPKKKLGIPRGRKVGNILKKLLNNKKHKAKKPNVRTNHLLEISQHNDLSYKTSTIRLRRAKHHKGLRGRYMFSQTWDYVNGTGNEGAQNTDEGKKMFTRAQITGDVSNVRILTDNWAIDPILLNPYVLSDNASSYFTGAQAYKEDRFHVETVQQKIHLVSLCTIPQIVKIYWLMYKKDSDLGVSQIWSNLLTAESLGQSNPVNAPYTSSITANDRLTSVSSDT